MIDTVQEKRGYRSFLSRPRDWNIDASRATTPHALWESRGFAVYDWIWAPWRGDGDVEVVADVRRGLWRVG